MGLGVGPRHRVGELCAVLHGMHVFTFRDGLGNGDGLAKMHPTPALAAKGKHMPTKFRMLLCPERYHRLCAAHCPLRDWRCERRTFRVFHGSQCLSRRTAVVPRASVMPQSGGAKRSRVYTGACSECKRAKRKCDGYFKVRGVVAGIVSRHADLHSAGATRCCISCFHPQSPDPCTRCAKRGLECDTAGEAALAEQAGAGAEPASKLARRGAAPGASEMLAALAEVLAEVRSVEGSWASEDSAQPPASDLWDVDSLGGDSASASDASSSLVSVDSGAEQGEQGQLTVHSRTTLSNVGFFARTAAKYGIDPRLMARRLVTLMAAPDMPTLWRALGGRVGGLPLGLLAPVAPSLRSRLAGSLGAFLPPMEVSRVLSTELAFDGVHLTLIGLAGAVVAVASGSSVVRVPACSSVLTCPRWQLHTPSVDMRASGSALGESDVEGVWSSEVDVGVLYGRWPHLCSMLGSVGEGVVSSARAMLEGEGRGEDVEPGPELLWLFHSHIDQLSVPAGGWVAALDQDTGTGSKTCVPLSCAFNVALSELLGFTRQEVIAAIHRDPDSAMEQLGDWIHPDCIVRRAVTSISAWNHSLRAFQMEGLFNRKVRVPVPGAAGEYTVEMLPFYAVETMHCELYPSGARRSEIMYISEVVHARSVARNASIGCATSQVNVLDALVLGKTPEVQAAVRLSGRSLLEALLDAADSDTREKLIMRIMMAMSFDSDAMLAAAIAPEAEAEVGCPAEAAHEHPTPPDAPAEPAKGSEHGGCSGVYGGLSFERLARLRRELLRVAGYDAIAAVFEETHNHMTREGAMVFGLAGQRVKMSFPNPGAVQFMQRFKMPSREQCDAWLAEDASAQ